MKDSKPILTTEQVEEIASQVVAEAISGMRVVIGDRTPRQYDRAEQMAGYIKRAVETALIKLKYAEEQK